MRELSKIKKRLNMEGKQGMALDIDDTLSQTSNFWVEQLNLKFGNSENLGVQELIAKYKWTQSVPSWQTTQAFAFTEKLRSNNRMQERIPLIEGSNSSVQKIHNTFPFISYITARPVSALKGTQKWLLKHNFPKLEIIARPFRIQNAHNIHKEQNKWKAELLNSLYPEIMGIVDDNPEFVDCLPKSYKGTIFLYSNKSYENNYIDICQCKTWNEIADQIENKFK